MVYSWEMRDLMPARTFSVTFAAVLAIFTGFYWLTASVGIVGWLVPGVQDPGLRHKAIVTFVSLGCVCAGTSVGGFGILFRQNWARVLAIVAAVPLIFLGMWSLYPFVRFPALLARGYLDVAFVLTFILPFLAAIAWPLMLIGKKVRAEFLPPAVVEIYVNLLDEGTPCARPARALTLGNGLFELLPTEGYDPAVERWEFRPGSIVRGKEEWRDGEAYLLATSFER